MERHDIGTYSTESGDQLELYMLQFPTHLTNLEIMSASVVYCMEAKYADNCLFWPDWLEFAHMVNGVAREKVLDIKADPALELGLVVDVGMECPNCGCRVMDALEWIDDDTVLCHGCQQPYSPGEN